MGNQVTVAVARRVWAGGSHAVVGDRSPREEGQDRPLQNADLSVCDARGCLWEPL